MAKTRRRNRYGRRSKQGAMKKKKVVAGGKKFFAKCDQIELKRTHQFLHLNNKGYDTFELNFPLLWRLSAPILRLDFFRRWRLLVDLHRNITVN